MVAGFGKASAKASAAMDKVKFARELDEEEIKEIKAKIADYLAYKATGDAKKDKATGNRLLKKYEEDA